MKQTDSSINGHPIPSTPALGDLFYIPQVNLSEGRHRSVCLPIKLLRTSSALVVTACPLWKLEAGAPLHTTHIHTQHITQTVQASVGSGGVLHLCIHLTQVGVLGGRDGRVGVLPANRRVH